MSPTSKPRRIDCEKEWHAEALHFLVDESAQQSCRESRIARLLEHERGGGADRELVKLARGRTVVKARYGLERHAHRVHVGEPSQQRVTARTILLTSTGSRSPQRLVTAIWLRAAGGDVRRKAAWSGNVT
jgi:hypothetical protein